MSKHDLELDEDGDIYCKKHNKFVTTQNDDGTIYFNLHSCVDEDITGETAE